MRSVSRYRASSPFVFVIVSIPTIRLFSLRRVATRNSNPEASNERNFDRRNRTRINASNEFAQSTDRFSDLSLGRATGARSSRKVERTSSRTDSWHYGQVLSKPVLRGPGPPAASSSPRTGLFDRRTDRNETFDRKIRVSRLENFFQARTVHPFRRYARSIRIENVSLGISADAS